MLKAYGKTDVGNVREMNQDDFNCGVLGDEEAVFAVVCDGMGGEKGGNIASRTACDIVTDSVTAAYGSGFGDNSIKRILQTAVTAANVSVFDRSQRDPSLRGMGTTIVAAIVCGGMAHIVHAGDSRAYHITSGGIEQVTKDHSVVQLLVDRGEITADEARFHPKKHFITRALGVMSIIDLDYCEFPMNEGDAIMVCTDGLSNYFSNDQLFEMIKSAGYSKCVDKLINAAKKEGGADNITVVCITK
ncbi:MAG: Stp1/IreP family PP2C-type Ser/Thr phosphatase [Oscillospiraceae bacterium]|nr:Stp1/IreP family PP2C-type Ser/Thr phosphatase [Oscillospiraceae bacterium]MBR3962764.1 Stp1/IreP family PP2C-type Ser/Thr phosphatase [Oscillospiraceae bacterium]MBR6657158.1 Stp1/IreP family PP2C-type Ser/Thr phosphatase [Oscillospiraceae bacterium]